MFTYQCVFVTYYVVGFALVLLTSRSKSDYILVLLGFVEALLHWLVWCLGQRFKSKFAYMIAALYIVDQILIAITAEVL